MLRRFVPLITLICLAGYPALADTPELHPHYLSPDAINIVDLLPEPPAVDSAEHQEELNLLIKLQTQRTPADIARATAEEKHLTVFDFADVLGSNFTAARCPKTAAFFKSALQADLSYFNKLAKNHWNRPRPYTDPRVHSLFIEKDGSYPSGHSIRATLFGEVLAAALPEHRSAIIARSQQMGWDREIAGVHYPSDIYAGRILGKALAARLLAVPEVQKQLEELKPELDQALSTSVKQALGSLTFDGSNSDASGMIKPLAVAALLGMLANTSMAIEYGKVTLACHRGENTIAPENTMASYNLAWHRGDQYCETDIQLTKDGKVVICHDADTYRTSGNKTKVVIKDATLAEVQAVDVGSFKDPKYKGEKCPTLDDLYDSIPDAHHGVYTEIKSGIDVVPAFVEIVKNRKMTPEQVIVISFHADGLEASKKALPEFKHYLLANHKKDKQHPGQYLASPNVDGWITEAKRIHADGLDLQAAPPLNEAECKKITDAGLELHIWTVDDAPTARKYIDWVKSITTNRAHDLRDELAKYDQK